MRAAGGDSVKARDALRDVARPRRAGGWSTILQEQLDGAPRSGRVCGSSTHVKRRDQFDDGTHSQRCVDATVIRVRGYLLSSTRSGTKLRELTRTQRSPRGPSARFPGANDNDPTFENRPA